MHHFIIFVTNLHFFNFFLIMSSNQYKATFIKMMSYLDGEDHGTQVEFSPERLGQLTPSDLVRWFNYQTFGEPEPPHGHNLNPTIRSHTLAFWKKAVSFSCQIDLCLRMNLPMLEIQQEATR
jgi:hypothetical protein